MDRDDNSMWKAQQDEEEQVKLALRRSYEEWLADEEAQEEYKGYRDGQ